MVNGHVPQGFPAFFVLWVTMGVVFSAFFYLNKDAALKRKVWPIVSIVTGLVFVGYVLSMGTPAHVLVIMIPFVALITLINLRVMRFCDECGRTVRTRSAFAPAKFCPHCGAPLVK